MYKEVIFRITVPGIHRWVTAPDEFELLRNDHRHLFYIEGRAEVTDNDREIEFIKLGSDVKLFINEKFKKIGFSQSYFFGSMSCEDIAQKLCKEFNLTECTVLEDNENGARVCR